MRSKKRRQMAFLRAMRRQLPGAHLLWRPEKWRIDFEYCNDCDALSGEGFCSYHNKRLRGAAIHYRDTTFLFDLNGRLIGPPRDPNNPDQFDFANAYISVITRGELEVASP